MSGESNNEVTKEEMATLKRKWLYIFLLMIVTFAASSGLSTYLQETLNEKWPMAIPFAVMLVFLAIIIIKRDELRSLGN